MAATASVTGDKALIAKLHALGKKGARAGLRKATRKGANIMLKAARASAPRRTGNYARGLKLKPRTKGGIVSTWVRATAPHSILVDYGSKERFHKTGKSTGTMPALRTMQNVAANEGPKALDVAVRELSVLIVAAAQGSGDGGGG